jgi:hypothetical protein
MSALHPRGVLDFASVLDDEKPAKLTKHSNYNMTSFKAMGIADVVHDRSVTTTKASTVIR